jgi:hypothetical protein
MLHNLHSNDRNPREEEDTCLPQKVSRELCFSETASTDVSRPAYNSLHRCFESRWLCKHVHSDPIASLLVKHTF